MLRSLVTAFVALVFLTCPFGTANACYCIFPENRGGCSKTWQSGDVIFLGKVTNKKRFDDPSLGAFGQLYAVHFSVTESFRGDNASGREMIVYTGLGHGDCGYPFVIGESYLVHAYSYPSGLD